MIKHLSRSFRRLVLAVSTAAAFTAAVPATAATYTLGFDFTAPDSGSEKTTSSSLSFTSTNSNLIATVTAWNVTPLSATNFKVTQAVLGWYQGGLGVISAANDAVGNCKAGDCGTHQIDNMGDTAGSKSYDFLQVSFSVASGGSQVAIPVTLGDLGLNAFGFSNTGISSVDSALDDDFSYGRNSGTPTNNSSLSSLAGLFQTNVGSNQADGFGGANGGCQDKNGDGVCANTFSLSSANSATANSASANWYLAASIADNYGGDGKVDGFKLATANVYYVQSAVPEPATWAMMLVGFGAVGMAIRRRAGDPIRVFA